VIDSATERVNDRDTETDVDGTAHVSQVDEMLYDSGAFAGIIGCQYGVGDPVGYLMGA
jgi:hypothetical protein